MGAKTDAAAAAASAAAAHPAAAAQSVEAGDTSRAAAAAIATDRGAVVEDDIIDRRAAVRRDEQRAAEPGAATAATADDTAARRHRVLDGQVFQIDVARIDEEATLGVEAVDRVGAAMAIAAIDGDARPAQQVEGVQLRRQAEVRRDVDRVIGILRGVLPAGIHLQDRRIEIGDAGDVEHPRRDDLHDRAAVGILRELEAGAAVEPVHRQRIGRGAVRDRERIAGQADRVERRVLGVVLQPGQIDLLAGIEVRDRVGECVAVQRGIVDLQRAAEARRERDVAGAGGAISCQPGRPGIDRGTAIGVGMAEHEGAAAVDAEIAAAADQGRVGDRRAGPDRNDGIAADHDRIVKNSAARQPEVPATQVERPGQPGELTKPELQGAGAR